MNLTLRHKKWESKKTSKQLSCTFNRNTIRKIIMFRITLWNDLTIFSFPIKCTLINIWINFFLVRFDSGKYLFYIFFFVCERCVLCGQYSVASLSIFTYKKKEKKITAKKPALTIASNQTIISVMKTRVLVSFL